MRRGPHLAQLAAREGADVQGVSRSADLRWMASEGDEAPDSDQGRGNSSLPLAHSHGHPLRLPVWLRGAVALTALSIAHGLVAPAVPGAFRAHSGLASGCMRQRATFTSTKPTLVGFDLGPASEPLLEAPGKFLHALALPLCFASDFSSSALLLP